MRFARQFGIERFEALRGGAEQGGRVPAGRPGERDLSAQAPGSRAVELLERRGRCDREQALGHLERPGVELQLRCRQRACAALGGIRAELGGALEERGGRRHATAGPRP